MRVREIAVRVRRVAEAQEGVIGRSQLYDCGLTGGEISRWIGQGRLIRVLPSVYALGHTSLSQRARLVAALLYAGPDALLSHMTAAILWQLMDRKERFVHVSTTSQRLNVEWVVIHRRRRLEPVRHERLPVTNVAQTLIDIAPRCRHAELRSALANADFHGLLDPASLHEEMRKGVHGSAAVRAAIKQHMPELARTRSPLEDKLLLLCESEGLPLPKPNVWVEGCLVDAFWAESRLIVEVDGRAAHSSASQKLRDAIRDERLRSAGYTVLRYTWADITTAPTRVASEIRAALVASV